MRKIYVILSLLIITFNASAQESSLKFTPTSADEVVSFNNKSNAVYLLDSSYKWNKNSSSSNWFLTERNYVLYDKDGIDTANINQTSNGVEPRNNMKLSKRYKNNLLDTLYVSYWLNESWVVNSYSIYEYINAKIIRSKTFDWDGTQWIEVYKTEYFYDNKANVTTLNIYGLAQSDLVLKVRKTYTYDFRNNITTITTEQINNTSLENFQKEIRSINEANNTVTVVTLQKWIKNNSRWQNDVLVKNFYNGTTLTKDSIFKYQGSTIVDSGSNEYLFNANKKLLSRTEYIYFSGLHKKAHVTKNVYDNNNNLITNTLSHYLLNDGTLMSADSLKYYYTNNTSIGINNNFEILNVYPNPASSTLHFKINEMIFDLYIYDSFGKMILQTSNIEILNIQNFPTGMYHVIINTESGKNYRSKFIKE